MTEKLERKLWNLEIQLTKEESTELLIRIFVQFMFLYPVTLSY